MSVADHHRQALQAEGGYCEDAVEEGEDPELHHSGSPQAACRPKNSWACGHALRAAA